MAQRATPTKRKRQPRKPLVRSEVNSKTRLDVGDINTEFLLCRRGNTGHQWNWTGDYDLVENASGRLIEATRVFDCLRCGAVKEQVFRLPSMEPAKGARITYPAGYLATERLHPIDVRREHWARTR